MRSAFLGFLVLAVLLTSPLPTFARRVLQWSYQDLTKEADVVVIARAIESENTKDEHKSDWSIEFEGVNTRFEVLGVLKGETDKTITLLHFEWGNAKPGKEGDDFIRNGPHLIEFKKGIPEYLLFLKRRSDGRYEPVSGQIDPDRSVREMVDEPRLRSAETTEKKPKDKVSSDDAAAISVAIQHFASQKKAPHFPGREDKSLVLIDTETLGPSEMYLSDGQIRSDTSSENWRVSVDLRDGLRQRNASKRFLNLLTFGKGVVAAELDKVLSSPPEFAAPEKYPEARAYARVWLPAYSKDGKTAVVRFAFGPTSHGATATYLLIKGKDGWSVSKWAFAFYA
jgi:hypothetical protein